MELGAQRNFYPPRLIYWEVTAGCNLRCAGCATQASSLLSPADLNHAESCRLVDQLGEYAPLTVVLSGGEPLWRRDLFLLAARARSKRLHLDLVTNGTLIDEIVTARILDAGIACVAVNLDGATAETHDGFRGQAGTFNAAVRGLRYLRALGVRTRIHAMITRHNAHQLTALLALAEQLQTEAFHGYLHIPTGCGFTVPETLALRRDEAQEILAWLYHRRIGTALDIKVTYAPHAPEAPRGGSSEGRAGTPLARVPGFCKSCLAQSDLCYISHSGEVYPCGYLPVSAGNLRTAPFGEIWRHAAAFELTRAKPGEEAACPCGEYRSLCSACHPGEPDAAGRGRLPRRDGGKSLPVM